MAADAKMSKPMAHNMTLDSKVRMAPLERELSMVGPSSKSQTMSAMKSDKERKIGHRRVDEAGQVTYKKTTTSELMATIQLGIGHSVGKLSPKPKRDVLYEDFHMVETIFFPREGSNLTPAHRYSDFRFKTYAPIAFRYFRDLFGIQPDDFLLSLCNEPLRELSNPGASGSIFYITNDDEFIIKTVQHKEAEFLQKLLPGYYMNLNQNPRTLLPKFYGLYCYQCGGKNIRFVVMNNLLPSSITMHSKYDLKGSTYKRKASKRELTKNSPTYKDLDFAEYHPDGFLLEIETYNALLKTVERDCRVLQSFKIMDYSMLLGVHNLDQSARDRTFEPCTSQLMDLSTESCFPVMNRGRFVRHRLAQYSTAMESIHATSDPLELDSDDVPVGGIPARSTRGDRLLIYLGIIDILQSYRFSKKLEHTFKAMVVDGDSISVHRPGFYAQRFQTFFANAVFKKIPSSLRHTPSKRKSVADRQKSLNEGDSSVFDKVNVETEQGAAGGRPDVLPTDLTPLPPYSLRLSGVSSLKVAGEKDSIGLSQTKSSDAPARHTKTRAVSTPLYGDGSAAELGNRASVFNGHGSVDEDVVLSDIVLQADVVEPLDSSLSNMGASHNNSTLADNLLEEDFVPGSTSSVSDINALVNMESLTTADLAEDSLPVDASHHSKEP